MQQEYGNYGGKQWFRKHKRCCLGKRHIDDGYKDAELRSKREEHAKEMQWQTVRLRLRHAGRWGSKISPQP